MDILVASAVSDVPLEVLMSSTLMMPWVKEAKKGAERRVFPRKEMASEIEGRRMDHTIEARRFPRLSLSLRDVSLGGLAAFSEVPINQGEKLAFTFPSTTPASHAWDAVGRVLRCDQSSLGYRIAVEFDPLPMAA
jgi:PilZ domain